MSNTVVSKLIYRGAPPVICKSSTVVSKLTCRRAPRLSGVTPLSLTLNLKAVWSVHQLCSCLLPQQRSATMLNAFHMWTSAS